MTTKITEARQSAAVKLQKAFKRAQEQTARERKAGEDLMNKNKEKPVKEGYRDYNNNRTGFAKRQREDDEYHVPDPVTQTHRIAFNVSKDGAEKHSRTVTISNSTKTKEQARETARQHLLKQGYKIHEGVVMEGAYEKSEENKRSADAAKKQGDMFAHHLHMADYHDNLAQWHAEKGRHGTADRHAAKSEEHHEQAMKLKESTDTCPVCGQTPCNCTHIEEAWSQGNRNPQRGIKVGHKVRSYDFPGMHDDHYVEGHVVGETPHSYHIRVNKVVRSGKEIPTPAHMTHVEAPKGKGMFNQAYAVHKIIAKQDSVAAAPEPVKGAQKTFSKIRGQR